MSYYVAKTGTRREYDLLDVLPPGVKIGRYGDHAFYAVEPYRVHAKPYGLKKNKAVEIDVYGVSGEYLLFKFTSTPELYEGYPVEGWHTCRFDQTTEGWRFVRSVVKVMKVLTSVAKKAAVERNKRERNRAAAKAREGREGTCQICEGRQIIQPTGENKGTLVLHGYRRPGYGETIGNCFGYHRKPFEVACDALVEWIASLKFQKASLEDSLARLPKREKLLVEVNWRTKEMAEITPDHPSWKPELERRTYNLEADIRAISRDITYHEERLAAWHKEHDK